MNATGQLAKVLLKAETTWPDAVDG